MDQIINFFKESYAELKKVTWLSRKEVMGSTLVIMILIFILSLFVALMDFAFVKLVGIII